MPLRIHIKMTDDGGFFIEESMERHGAIDSCGPNMKEVTHIATDSAEMAKLVKEIADNYEVPLRK